MKNSKCISALLVLVLTLTMVSGCSAEQADETRSMDASGMDVAVDEAEALNDAQADEDNDGGPIGVQIPFALSLDTTTASLDYSQRVILTASASIGVDSIQWSCSDENVVSISRTTGESVTVTALNEGTATVSCSLGGAKRSCEVTVKPTQTLQITGIDYPARLERGKSWKLQGGTVASTENLASLTSVIKGADGTELEPAYTKTFSADVKRFEISGIDTHVPFSRILEDGSYTWTLSATDASGNTVTLELPINVVSDGGTEVATEKGAYASADSVAAPQEESQAIGTESATSDDAQAAVQSPVEAGINLLRGTGSPSVMKPVGAGNWSEGIWGLTSGGDGRAVIIDVNDCPSNGITKGFSITGNTNGNKDITQEHVPYVPGQTYTVSLYARVPSGTAKLYVRAWDVANGVVNTVIIRQDISNTAWERYSGTFTFDGDTTNVSAQFGITGPGDIDVCGFKLEIGDTASEWTAAPEDAYINSYSIAFTINIPAEGWITDAENQNLCHIDIPVAGLSSVTKNAYIESLVQTGAEAIDAPTREAFGLLTRGVVGDGKVTFYALRPPTIAFTLRLVAIATDTPVTEIIGLANGY